jgi:hypothetical protein
LKTLLRRLRARQRRFAPRILREEVYTALATFQVTGAFGRLR